MTETTDDAVGPWKWRGVAWVVVFVGFLSIWGAAKGITPPDPLIIEYMARPAAANPVVALIVLSLANWAPLLGLAMGLRFRHREKATPEYRAQANAIIFLSLASGVAITWITLSEAWRLSEPWR